LKRRGEGNLYISYRAFLLGGGERKPTRAPGKGKRTMRNSHGGGEIIFANEKE